MAENSSDSIFRKKSIDNINSPEALNDYIRVTSPPAWLVLLAVMILLTGIFVWCAVGTVQTHTPEGETEDVHPITYALN